MSRLDDLIAAQKARADQALAHVLADDPAPEPPVRVHPDAAVLRAAAAVVEAHAKTRPHLMSLVNRLLTLAADLTPEPTTDDQEDQ